MAASELGSLFEPAEYFLLRVAALPLEALTRGLDFKVDEQLLTALRIASPSLSNALRRQPEDARARNAAARYRSRMATRSTPFGLFAGVALGRWGTHQTGPVLENPIARVRARLDGGWLSSVINSAIEDEELRRSLTFFWHEGAVVRGPRVLLNIWQHDGDVDSETEWLPASKAITAIAREAQNGASYDELVATATRHVPQDAAYTTIAELLRAGFLVSDVNAVPIADTGRRTARILAKATSTKTNGSIIGECLDILEAQQSSDGVQHCLTEIESRLQTIRETDNILACDAAAEVTNLVLPRSVASDLCDAATTLLKLSVFPKGRFDLASYRGAFHERYGANAEVALLDVIDPIRGLGSPREMEPSFPLKRSEALMRLAALCIREGTEEMELTDELIAALEPTALSPSDCPLSIDLLVAIGAKNALDLCHGEYSITIEPGTGALAAGKHAGRFADILGSQAEALFREILQAEQASEPYRLDVELVSLPEKATLLNVCTRTVYRPYAIFLGVPPVLAPSHRVLLKDIDIGIRDQQFYAKWKREGIEIRAGAWHMLNPFKAPLPLRFLSELRDAGKPVLTAFLWGNAGDLPYLPRLRRGRVVIAPRRWKIARDSVPAHVVNDKQNWTQWFADWCKTWNCPTSMMLGRGDQRLFIDSTLNVEEVRGVLLRGGAATFTEVSPPLDRTWLKSKDGRHRSDIAVSLLSTYAGPWRPPELRPRQASSTARVRPVGSDWLAAHIYAPLVAQDYILAGPLRQFLRHMDMPLSRWFFIRYNDGEPHMRLRINGDPRSLTNDALPALNDLARALVADGWCKRVEYKTYEREVERYGGDNALCRVEEWFWDDSQLCLDMINCLIETAPACDRRSVAAITSGLLAEALSLDQSLFESAENEQAAKVAAGVIFRSDKVAILSGLSGEPLGWLPPRVNEQLHAAVHSAKTLAAALRQDLSSVVFERCVKSIVHMHYNRLLGAGRAEAEARCLIARAHRSHQLREKRSAIGLITP